MSDNIQDKLFHYEVSPPPGVWDEISTALDDQPTEVLGEKLYHFESVPDKKVWNRLQQLLQHTKADHHLPFFQRYRRPLRYSGAAVMLIIIGTMLSLLVSKKTVSEVPATSSSSQQPGAISNPANENAANEPNSRTTVAGIPDKSKNAFRRNLLSVASSLSISRPSLSEGFLVTAAERHTVIADNTADEKYMIYSDGNGHAFRLPKKIFDAFACPLEDVTCKQRIKILQEKMAGAALTTDFGGILQILEHLQENQ
jgi:hypothetical protein